MDLIIKPAEMSQELQLFELYKEVSRVKHGLIRNESEISRKYISGFMSASIDKGLILVGLINNTIVGEIHAYTPDIYAFRHILTDLTIVIDPGFHGQGIGRALFEEFLKTAKEDYRHILRIELFVREQNERNVSFYKSLGFINEGRQENKIFNSKSGLETPLHMVWFNPNSFFTKFAPNL